MSTMRHYEVVLLVHPDQSSVAAEMLERYVKSVIEHKGVVHRSEDWGRRQLAYEIQKTHKAHYLLLNIECSIEFITKLRAQLALNDAILRCMILSRKTALTAKSFMLTQSDSDKKDKFNDAMANLEIKDIDYTNLNLLRELTMENGRIIPGRLSELNAKQQRKFSWAVKIAREISLLAYCSTHR